MRLPRLQVRTHLIGRRHPAERRWSVLRERRVLALERSATLLGNVGVPLAVVAAGCVHVYDGGQRREELEHLRAQPLVAGR